MYVDRKFVGTRAMNDLKEHVKTGFCKYGTIKATYGKMLNAFKQELKYKNEVVYADIIDLTLLEDDTDNKIEHLSR